MLRQIWPALVLGTAVVVGISLFGRWKTEGFGSEVAAGGGIGKRKNFPYREDYGYQDISQWPKRVKY